MVLLLAVLVGSTLACGDSVTAPDLLGSWGGAHVSLIVTESGATIEYDCAHGTINESLVLDGLGNFDVSGTHTREHPGPIREGEIPDEHPVRYTGWTDGGNMDLTVSFVDTGERIGTFSLIRGSPARLVKCL
jgi:hypothetical protein